MCEINAILQEQRRHCMTQHVGCDTSGTNSCGVAPNNRSYRLVRNPAPTPIDEQWIVWLCVFGQSPRKILIEGFAECFAHNWDFAFTISFAAHRDDEPIHVNVTNICRSHLTYSHSS